MSRLRIVNQSGSCDAFGTQLFIDDSEVSGVRSIDLKVHLEEPVKANVEVIATEDLDVQINAQVSVTIVALPGYTLAEEPQDDGSTIYRAVRE